MRADYGGQRDLMEDRSMQETLRWQAELIWPAERAILRRTAGDALSGDVLDLACGTGEILRRLRREFRPRRAVGLDLFPGHLHRAEPPVVHGDGYALPFAEGTFDLVLVRHLLQALPDPVGLLREARRVLRRGGRIHLLAEDYFGLFFDDPDDDGTTYHFSEVAPRFRREGTDLLQGRRAPRHLAEAGFGEVAVEPLLVDNREGRGEALARVFLHWRDGYARKLAQLLGVAEAETRRRFDRMAELARDPGRYTAWLLFVVRGRRLD